MVPKRGYIHSLHQQSTAGSVSYRLSRRAMVRAMPHLTAISAATRVPAFGAEILQRMDGADGLFAASKECIDGDLKKAGLPAFRHLPAPLKFMECCEPEPADYSTMSDEELMERAASLSAE